MRRRQAGDVVTYVVNRNINFTNVCIKHCTFCAFSRDHREEEGYLLPTENVMQFLGLGLALLSFAGGLFIPLSQFPQILQDIAQWTPLYGLNQLVHAPMLGVGVQWAWAVNAVAWLVIFAGGAVWRFRKDTARV